MRDIVKGEDAQIRAVGQVINHVAPDILLLTDIDFDAGLSAVAAFSDTLAQPYPHLYAALPNAGQQLGLDLNGDGYTGDARDALGYGRFLGDGGMAVLSRYPIMREDVVDLSGILWRDVLGSILPEVDGAPFPNTAIFDDLPVSSTGHWMVPIDIDGTRMTLLAFDATPPVFDGAEDFNGLRNRDEARLWQAVLEGHFGPAPTYPVLIGNANADPFDGEGFHDAITALLTHPALQTTNPRSAGAAEAATAAHAGPPELDTADWPEDGPGNLRVSYVLPAADLHVVDQGVFWPAPSDPLAALLDETGPHRIVWVDVALPQ
ncbi:endonuclease/exonuclease/phosphatase family protein [Pseudooctadecabacter sp.]|uniref:endonuclease/exonuclease/phosphatase family protein n=1 Tax=Pseudooctadecabacter sp. TaxID=1966338 RepID=UPI0035C7A4B6